MENEKKQEEVVSEPKVKRYGGYAFRYQYEKSKKSKKAAWLSAIQIGIFAVLLIFCSILSVVVYKGFLTKDPSTSDSNNGSTVKVPTQADLNQILNEPEEMLSEVEYSLITVEVSGEDGTNRYGTGFMISTQGYALCASSLLNPQVKGEFRAYSVDGLSYSLSLVETVDELGFSILYLEDCYGAIVSPVGNFSFVERGETLYAVGSVYRREYYGTALAGIAASVGKNMQVTVHGKNLFVPMVFLDVQPNESLYGGPVVDVYGNVIGFCTDKIASPYGNLTAALSINVVLSLVNDILGEH